MEYAFDKEEHHKSNKTTDNQHPTPSNSELMSSAKIVADAAKAKFQNDPNYKFEKNEVAGAAENLLHAASHYGKLDEKGSLGKVVGKAENYLHQYHSSQTTTIKQDHSTTTTTTTTTTETVHTKPGKDHESHSGDGYGDYMKMAEGLLHKHSSGAGDHEGHSGSGYGDYVKMAGDFLKK